MLPIGDNVPLLVEWLLRLERLASDCLRLRSEISKPVALPFEEARLLDDVAGNAERRSMLMSEELERRD